MGLNVCKIINGTMEEIIQIMAILKKFITLIGSFYKIFISLYTKMQIQNFQIITLDGHMMLLTVMNLHITNGLE